VRASAVDVPIESIEPRKGLGVADLRELWRYRELMLFFTWRDILVRYKQTLLGYAWAIIQPLFLMVVFSVFLGELAGVPSEGVPYPIFAYAALLPWTFFANALARSSGSLVGNSNLLRKVYFPRLVLPISGLLSGLVDFAVASSVLLGLMVYFGVYPQPEALLVVLPLIVLVVLTALSVGLWLAALNVTYRDVQQAVPFLVQVWLFATPVVYPATIVPEEWRSLLGLNPMSGIISGFRWAVLGTGDPPGAMLAVSVGITALLLASGLVYFKRAERSFADVV
jgi:lipopolysaccharide transport system permease protein